MSISHRVEHRNPTRLEMSISHRVEHQNPNRQEMSISHRVEHRNPTRREMSISHRVEHRNPTRREMSISHRVEHQNPTRREMSISHRVEHRNPTDKMILQPQINRYYRNPGTCKQPKREPHSLKPFGKTTRHPKLFSVGCQPPPFGRALPKKHHKSQQESKHTPSQQQPAKYAVTISQSHSAKPFC
jgi:hypothetical protein